MSILNCVTVAAKHTALAKFAQQWPDMICDGQWAISRTALQKLVQSSSRNAPKVATFLKDAMLAPIDQAAKDGLFDELCGYKGNEAAFSALEVAPMLTAYNEEKGTLMCRFDAVNGDMRIFANAHFAKLLSDLFPGAEWAGRGELKPVALIQCDTEGDISSGEVVAFYMPSQCKKQIPGWSANDQKLGLTNTEILMYVYGVQGGTLSQISKALGIDEQSILSATPDEMREHVRTAQAKRIEHSKQAA